eukprot:360593-Rhodomonas_salina.1
MAVQLEAAEKEFEMVKDLCYHIQISSLAHIIADSAGVKGSEGVTWKLANNRLISLLQLIDCYVKPLLMSDIHTAIRIAQLHIESSVDKQEVFTPGAAAALKVETRDAGDSNDTSDVDADEEKLKQFIARKQKTLAVLQQANKPTQKRGCNG